MVSEEEEGGNGMEEEFGINVILLHLEWINNELPLYSTGNYIQYLGIERDGR